MARGLKKALPLKASALSITEKEVPVSTEEDTQVNQETAAPEAPVQAIQPEEVRIEPTDVLLNVVEVPLTRGGFMAAVAEELPKAEAPKEEEPKVETSSVVRFNGKLAMTVSDEMLQMLGIMQSKGNAALTPVLDIINYTSTMRPGVRNDEQLVLAAQMSLYRSILLIIRTSEESFKLAWLTLLRLVQEHKYNGAWRDDYLFRGMENIGLNKTQRDFFVSILTLLKETSDPATRKQNVKRMKFDREMRSVLTEADRQRLKEFYGI
jgi:hypothetical protein